LRSFAILTLAFISVMTALAQQIPDQSYRPPIGNPGYATGNGPLVCVDEAHTNFHTLADGFWAFGELLRRDGYVTRPNKARFTLESLRECRVLVIANAQPGSSDWNSYPYPTPSAFQAEEVLAVRGWVASGGALLLIADHLPLAGAAANLASAFGVNFVNGFAVDGFETPEEREAALARPTLFTTAGQTLRPHVITRGRRQEESVSSIRTFTGQAFQSPQGMTPLLVLPPTFVMLMPEKAWQFRPETPRIPAAGWLQGGVMQVEAGRAAFFGEAAMFSAQVAGPDRIPIGMNGPQAEQNYRFVLNLMHWLSGLLP